MFKKKGSGKRDVRARETAPRVDEDDKPSTVEADDSTVVLKKRKLGNGIGPRNPLHQGTGATLSSRRDNDALNSGVDDVDDEYDNEDMLDRYGEARISTVVRSRANDDDDDDSGRIDAAKEGPTTANNDDGVYRGTSSYSKYTTTRDDGRSSKITGVTAKGPVKSKNSAATLTLVDYQPDVCKDYKETGYCGFGDTCKFMHDRSDYLAGWQVDALPNSSARRRGDISDEEAIDEEEEIPFACLLCRQPFTDPIVTKCGHYFCSACAIKRFSKTSKCFACGKQTQGIFNSATKVLQRMEVARKVREEEREQRKFNRGNVDLDQQQEQDTGEILEGVEIG